MKLTLICVGKLSLDFIRVGAAEYAQRVQRYTTLELIEIKEEKGGGKKAPRQHIRSAEEARIAAKIPAGAYVIALDEAGKQHNSEQFARLLERHMIEGTGCLCLIVAGAYGFSATFKQGCDMVLSLSQMTMTHQMARMFLLEQIYRGFTIVRNEPYHNR